MRLYVDDDLAGAVLTKMLRKAGHEVRLPAEIGLAGTDDAKHLCQAILENRALLSANYDDFKLLHELIRQSQGHHSGILIVRFDNDPRRDLKRRDIVRAIANLEAAGAAIADQYIILNHWR